MAHESQNACDKMWPPHIEKIFIDIMVDEQQKGNMEHGTFKASTWLSITNALNEQTGKSFCPKQVIQKHNRLRQRQRKWSQLLSHTELRLILKQMHYKRVDVLAMTNYDSCLPLMLQLEPFKFNQTHQP